MQIEVEDLCFSYGERQVLKNISFSAHEGELIALLGPNGVGKSTLMRCMLGFLKSCSGNILLDGENIRHMRRNELSKRIAYIPQSVPVTFNYTVLDTVLMGVTGSISPLSAPGAAQEAGALEALESLGVAHLARRGVEEISGGERQLVLLARALVQNAHVLIMDEPTANLDYGNQNRVMERTAELAERGYIVLISAHDPNQALMYASRALILRDGCVLCDDTPDRALTEEVLQSVYGIPVRRYTVPDATVCVPRRRGT